MIVNKTVLLYKLEEDEEKGIEYLIDNAVNDFQVEALLALKRKLTKEGQTKSYLKERNSLIEQLTDVIIPKGV